MKSEQWLKVQREGFYNIANWFSASSPALIPLHKQSLYAQSSSGSRHSTTVKLMTRLLPLLHERSIMRADCLWVCKIDWADKTIGNPSRFIKSGAFGFRRKSPWKQRKRKIFLTSSRNLIIDNLLNAILRWCLALCITIEAKTLVDLSKPKKWKNSSRKRILRLNGVETQNWLGIVCKKMMLLKARRLSTTTTPKILVGYSGYTRTFEKFWRGRLWDYAGVGI